MWHIESSADITFKFDAQMKGVITLYFEIFLRF